MLVMVRMVVVDKGMGVDGGSSLNILYTHPYAHRLTKLFTPKLSDGILKCLIVI